nr:MAG TPA: hypothetical protein [Caudoviricetes sp.]
MRIAKNGLNMRFFVIASRGKIFQLLVRFPSPPPPKYRIRITFLMRYFYFITHFITHFGFNTSAAFRSQ